MTAHDTDLLDYLVLGAGPAGLQLSYHLARRGRSHLVLEEGPTPGTFFRRYPRHRQLISINKVHTGIADRETNLRWDWNSLLGGEAPLFREYSHEYFPPADRLVDYLCDYAERGALPVRCNTRVERVLREDGAFVAEAAGGERFRARRMVVATGRALMNLPQFPGLELCEPYDTMPVDPRDFTGQRVMILGKGNSGMETADALIPVTAALHLLSPNPVRLAWKTHYVGDLRAVNNNLLDTYQLKSQNTVLDAHVLSVTRRDGGLRVHFRYTHAEGQELELMVDRVLLCTGFRFDASPFDPASCPVQLTPCGRYPRMTSAWEAEGVPGLYFAGTLMHMRDYRKSFSGFIHGFRYNVELLDRLLEHRHQDAPLEFAPVEPEGDALAAVVLDRVNRASSMFQQPGYMADVYVVPDDGGPLRHYRDLTTDYLFETGMGPGSPFGGRRTATVTMEYGHLDPAEDPFNIYRYPTDGTRSVFIHPVIRVYGPNGAPCAEHHVPEDLENQWDRPMYSEPLREFLATVPS